MRLDWENLREPRLLIASSDVNVCSTLWKRTRWGVRGRLTIKVEKRSLKSRVNGRSSSVMRRSREDVWCILLCEPRNVDPDNLEGEGEVCRSGKSRLRSVEAGSRVAIGCLGSSLIFCVSDRVSTVPETNLCGRNEALLLVELVGLESAAVREPDDVCLVSPPGVAEACSEFDDAFVRITKSRAREAKE